MLRSASPKMGLVDLLVMACKCEDIPLTSSDVDAMLKAYHLRDFSAEDQFHGFLTLLIGDRRLRIMVAHRLLKRDGNGEVSASQFCNLLHLFGLNPSEAEAIAVEISADGSTDLSEQAFVNFLPEDFNAHPKAYHAGQPARISSVSPAPQHVENIGGPELASEVLSDLGGTSPLQLQIGLFRLLQGAAYRCFRASYSANSETHLRAYDLPYTIFNFVTFVNKAIDYYQTLDIVEAGAMQPLEDLRASINASAAELRNRMAAWDPKSATTAMQMAEAGLENELSELEHNHQIVAATLDLVLSGAAMGHRPSDLTPADLQTHELNRLRQIDDHRELSGHRFDVPAADSPPEMPFIDSWQRVIIDDADNHYAGAIMPTRYWYEDFMPKLLRACTVRTVEDLALLSTETEADLNAWFDDCLKSGKFSPYAIDIIDNFPKCELWVKQEIRQAWRLSQHYLNGVQKRREREEFGRDSGYLSEYVTFIDLYLGRSDIADSEMRISFPYFIGPATWRFLHTGAEIVNDLPQQDQLMAVERFKGFFGALATVYPCPYCRFHLNRYVVKNRELHLYPIEYLLLGPQTHSVDIEVTIDQKLTAIGDAPGLRMFLWKLHNTVSSSITRSETWYQRDQQAHYTSRYWPSLDSELARAKAVGSSFLNTDRVERIYGVMKQAAHLAVVRDELQLALAEAMPERAAQIVVRAEVIIPAAEKIMLASRFLRETYHFNPLGNLTEPHFSAEEEALARSGYFTEA
jgi:hypothetical protein